MKVRVREFRERQVVGLVGPAVTLTGRGSSSECKQPTCIV